MQNRFNGGGHINHSIFWQNLCSKGDAMGAPDGELAKAIDRDFGSFDAMKEKLSASTVAVQVRIGCSEIIIDDNHDIDSNNFGPHFNQGSGWGWLGYNKATGRLQIATCANQECNHDKNILTIL